MLKITAKTVLIADASRAAGKISLGLALPAWALSAITVVGTRVREELFITSRVTISSVARSWPLSFLSSHIAFCPAGVAALPNPSMLAARFMVMALVASLLFAA